MSAFLGFESLLIPLGSTVQNTLDQFRTSLTSYGWQVPRRSVFPLATLGTLGTVANAFDLDHRTSASSAAALPLWVGCQLASAFTPTAFYIGTTTNGTYGASNFTLDYSDNGSTWTTHQTWTGEPAAWKYFERRKYTVTGASAHTYWRVNVTARATGTTLEISDFILEDATGNWVTNLGFIDIMPPVTETIGNATAREFIRITVGGSTILFRPMQELLQAMPAVWEFTSAAGAVTSSLTINGVTVSYVGITGNTQMQNSRGLFEACRNSVDANFTAYTWNWVNWEGYFAAYRTTPVLQSTTAITGSNVTIYNKSGFCSPQPQYCCTTLATNSITMDLTNGFIYYLQVNARGIALATKTNVGYYGPIHAVYGDNASAVAQTPTAYIPVTPCTPIELLIGTDDVATSTGATARVSHWWGSCQTSYLGPQNPNATYTSCNMWTGSGINLYASDYSTDSYDGNPSSYVSIASSLVTMRSEGIFTGGDSGVGFRIHRLVADPDTVWSYCYNSSYYARAWGPVYNNLDWYRITGTLTDEQLVMIPGTDAITYCTSNVLTTDVVINVNSTTGFLSTGFIVIEGEVIQYTGITSTSFTGCTRAKYSTTAMNHYINDKVNIGQWFVKINTGLLFAGYLKPV